MDSAGETAAGGTLASWLRLGHPRYRSLLLALLAAGAIAAAATYAENLALVGLTRAFAVPLDRSSSLSPLSETLALPLPWLFLCAFVLLRVLRAALLFGTDVGCARLRARAWADLEQQVLRHLLRRTESFFAAHPTAEIVTRLEQDAPRAVDRRTIVVRAWGACALIAGNVAFFLYRDLLLGVVGVLVVVLGATVSRALLGPVRERDRRFLDDNEASKRLLGDLLSATSEVQVGSLYQPVEQRFAATQERRTASFLGFARLQAFVEASHVLTGTVALAAMIMLADAIREGPGAETAALIPVVIWAMPKLFESASRLVMMRFRYHMGTTSAERLLAYEAERTIGNPAPSPAEPVPIRAVVLDGVRFRYRDEGSDTSGGLSEATVTFAGPALIAVVGPTGAGKSTLVRLALGLERPDAGEVRYVTADGTTLSQAPPGAFALLPQHPTLLDTTIGDNLYFGAPAGRDGSQRPTSDELALIERTGVGQLCRRRALDLPFALPPYAGKPGKSDAVAALERDARARVAQVFGRGRRSAEPRSAEPVPGTRHQREREMGGPGRAPSWRESLLPGWLAGGSDAEQETISDVLLDVLEASPLRDHATCVGLGFAVGWQGERLSGGERQLVALCRTLLRPATAVVVDEPTSSLDATRAARVWDLLREEAAARLVVVVTHDREAAATADRVVSLRGGRCECSRDDSEPPDADPSADARAGGRSGAAAA